MNPPSASNSLVVLNLPTTVSLRVFCFPYAGGGTSVFRSWCGVAPPGVEIVALRLPGRESRFRAPLVADLDALIDELAPQVASQTDVPYGIFGYSMGAIIGYELARRLQTLDMPSPRALVVGGSEAPQLGWRHPPIHALPTERFVQRLRELDGTPAEIFEEPELLALLLPTLRSDFALIENYQHRAGPPLQCPMAVYSAVDDRELDPSRVDKWDDLCAVPVVHRRFPGGHFFLNDRPHEMALAALGDISHAPG